ncbi:MAG: hypothetical protein GYA29_03405 [Methanothrix sp.]|nr:hypothetical protein [Methanothrix sp.]
MAKKSDQILMLPAIVGSLFAVIIGSLVLFFALPSLGRQAEYGSALSPVAGAILFILLGLTGALGAAIAAESRKAERGLVILDILLSLFGLAALAFSNELAACASIVMVVAASLALQQSKRGSALLLFAGLAGFPLSQAAMTFLPYGWKIWSISGVLFVFCGILSIAKKGFIRLPLLNSNRRESLLCGYLLYPLLSLLLIFLSVAALVHVPVETSSDMRGSVISETKECDCMNDCPKYTNANASMQSQSCSDEQLKAEIISPGDVRTFPHDEAVCFEAKACKMGQIRYLWHSDLDGVIGREERFNRSDLSIGWHNITLTITDSTNASSSDSIELGISGCSVCGNVSPRPRYYPVDTSCQDIWPNATARCQEFEVCNPDLDYIVADAVNCCDGTPVPGSACAYACANSGGDKKRCRGLYIIRAFGPEATYMQGYALFKACCSGYPECTRTCGLSLAGTCSFRDGFNENVSRLSCRPDEWGVSAWRSDTNMSENSAVLGMFPTHATVNILRTGICIDYAAALTTMLRKAGYNKTEAMSTASTGYDLPLLGSHPGHAYNLVLLPGDAMYHLADTTGNGEGINLLGVPHYFYFTGCFLGQPVKVRVFDWWVDYCNKTASTSYNDAGEFETPKKTNICGCPDLN